MIKSNDSQNLQSSQSNYLHQNENPSSQNKNNDNLEENLSLEDEMFKFIENDISVKSYCELNNNNNINL